MQIGLIIKIESNKGGKRYVQSCFQLEPLTCPSCVKKIETALGKTPGVDTVRVLFNLSKVKAEFGERKIRADQIEKVMNKLGYKVVSSRVS